jgi:hypothetical protein
MLSFCGPVITPTWLDSPGTVVEFVLASALLCFNGSAALTVFCVGLGKDGAVEETDSTLPEVGPLMLLVVFFGVVETVFARLGDFN